MMRLFGNVIKFLPVALLSTSALAANSDVAKVQLVDFSGKPPFKREVVELSVHDIAKLEAVSRNDEPLEYATVRTVDMRGNRPTAGRWKQFRFMTLQNSKKYKGAPLPVLAAHHLSGINTR